MKKQILTGLLAATLCTNAFAGEVTGYTPATSGEVATAEAINTRFDALIAAINDNNARVAELESFDVSGKTYDFKEVAMAVAGGFVVSQLTFSGQMAFASDGTATINGTEREVETSSGSAITVENGPIPETTVTWTQSGSAVTVTFPDGFTFEFAVSRGATMFTGIIENFIFSDNTSVESSIQVGTLIE